jgi:serine/threonine protein kinase
MTLVDEPDPLMRVLDLRAALAGAPSEFVSDHGNLKFTFADEEPRIGGFAAVFKIRYGGRDCALKVAHRTGSSIERLAQHSTSSELQQLLRECGGAVPLVYGIGSVAGASALLMTWEEGESLSDCLGRLGRRRWRPDLDLTRLRRWSIAIVVAMEELERRVAELRGDRTASKFVHGDLKPSNILIRKGRSKRERFCATLLDFGESMIGESVGPTGYTKRYASPELVSQMKGQDVPIDWRSDQYAIGQILHEGLDAIASKREGSVFLPQFTNLRRIANRMTDTDTDARFKSWQSLLLAIRARREVVVIKTTMTVASLVAAGFTAALLWHLIGRITTPSAPIIRIHASGPPEALMEFTDAEFRCKMEPYGQPTPERFSMSDAEPAEIKLLVDGDQPMNKEIRFVLEVGPPMPDSFRPGNWIGVARSWWKQSELVDTIIPRTEQQTIRQALIEHIPLKKTVEGVTYTIEVE